MCPSSSRRLAVLLAIGALAAACADDQLTNSRSRQAPLAPAPHRLSLSMAAPSASGSVDPQDSNQDETDQLGNYPHHTLAVITVAGSATMVYNDLPEFGDLANTELGVLPPEGWFNGWSWGGNCSGNVSWNFSVTGGRYVCYYDNWGAPRVYSDTTVIKGDGTFTWHRGFRGVGWTTCNGSGEPPCFLIDGGFTISVEPIPAALVLTASATSVTPSTSVTFTASATPAAVNADSRLLTIQSWQWTPDSGSQTVSCGTNKTCGFTPQSSGTMKVTAIVNGTEQSAERYVIVNSCSPVTDSLLNNPRVRRGFDSLLTASRIDTVATQRIEQGALLWGLPSGEIVIEPHTPISPSMCHFNWGAIPPDSGGRVLVGRVHTHPFRVGELTPCNPSTIVGRYPGGWSGADWLAVNAFSLARGYNVPSYIVDPTYIHRLDPSPTAPGDWRTNSNLWHRNGAGCPVAGMPTP